MSRTHKDCGFCRYDDTVRLPLGSRLVIAIAIGSMMLGIAVFLHGAGLGWALLTWFAANPCGLAIAALTTITERCPPGECRFWQDDEVLED